MRRLVVLGAVGAFVVIGQAAMGGDLESASAVAADCAFLDAPMTEEPAQWSADGRWLAGVDASPDERSDIDRVVAVRPGTGKGRVVFRRSGSEWNRSPPFRFRWAPKGERMVIQDHDAIYVGGPDVDSSRIAEGCFGAWAPDGKRIAYTADGVVYTIRPDGSGRRAVSPGDTVEAWSPDGRRLAVVRRIQRPTCIYEHLVPRLFVLDLLTRRIAKATTDRRPFDGVEHERGWQSEARFSADGRHLSFTEGAACDDYTPDPNYEPPVFVQDLKTRRERMVGFGWRPSWAPTGGYLGVFDRHNRTATIVTPVGRRVASFPAMSGLSWSPGGKRVVHSWLPGPPFDWSREHLYVRGVVGDKGVRLVARVGTAPIWSPDGKYVAFLRTYGCGRARVVVRTATGRTRRVFSQRCS